MVKKCVTLKIGKPVVRVIDEPYPECFWPDFVGIYSNTFQPGCIVRATKTFYEDFKDVDTDDVPRVRNHNEFSFYMSPETGEEYGSENYRKYALQNYERAEAYNAGDWQFVIFTIKVPVTADNYGLETVYEDSFSGVESNYTKEYSKEIIAEYLMPGVKNWLSSLGFSQKEIAAAAESLQFVEP